MGLKRSVRGKGTLAAKTKNKINCALGPFLDTYAEVILPFSDADLKSNGSAAEA